MAFFEQVWVMELMDGAACALLAAAAANRAKGMGAPLAGSVCLGLFCGLMASLSREVVLHGHDGLRLIISAMPGPAFAGAVSGAILTLVARGANYRFFFWLDAAGMALAGTLASVLALAELGISGAVTLGLACGLLPGLFRDMAIGDTAMLVEKAWYAATCAIGCLMAICLVLLPYFLTMPSFFVKWHGEVSVAVGMLVTIGLRRWKDAPLE